ncbi:MAG: uroporphyrinogen-III synthase [Helicobacter sp.]|nr:uroporphyrinogen-III synthase [Helicobacter sp.]
MKTIYYITYTPKTPVSPILESYKNIKTLDLLKLSILKDSNLLEKLKICDSLIFTSKNAIFALQKTLKDKWHDIPCYVIGNGSNQALKHFGIKAAFVGKGIQGDSFAKDLSNLLKEKNPLFIRAQKIASRLIEILQQANIPIEQSILYKSSIITLNQQEKNQLKPPKDSIIFFSAPSCIQAFLKNFSWQEDYIALCIGKTTLESAKNALGSKATLFLSPKANIKESLHFARHL